MTGPALEPPIPTGTPVQLLDQWEVYEDSNSGRRFYVHSISKERTWKPPRSFPPKRDVKMTSQSESSNANLISPTGKTGAVQMRIKNANAQHDRLTQTKSMILETSVEITKPVSRHRRNHSQHYISDKIVSKDMLVNKNKEGVLNKTKITDKGKKLRKNWTASYAVLSDHKLEFLKESKEQAASGLKSTTNPEVIDLWGAQVEWANEKSSRRNVFQVLVMWIGLTLYSRNPYAIQTVLRKDIHRHVTDWTNASQNPKCHGFNNSTRFTVTAAICAVSQTEGELLITTSSGNEFLLQSDEDVAILEWFEAIKNTIDSLGTKQQFTPLGINLQKSSSTELLNLADEAKEKKNEHRKSLIFKLNYSASDTSDRNRVKTRLKKFISRRPSLKTLQEKGLIKDQVFGCHLETLCKRENTTVPHFVKQCIEAIEKRGLDADGIYRVSGNLSIIQKLRFIVNQEEKLNLDDSQWEDIHVVTGVLKMFFRELPEPLFPYSFFEQFVEAIKIQENDLRVKFIRNLVKKLPRPNHDTMKTLFEHLRKITIGASVNLMSTQSLGIVFGPTLLRPEMDKGNMAVCMVYQNQIVELMLMEYENIFC